MFVFITKTQTVHRKRRVYSSPAVQYLRFKVPVHNSYIVHVTDGRHQLSHDAAGLCFAEMLLSADPLQQLPSTEQLQDQECVELQQTHTHRIYLHFSLTSVTPISNLYSLCCETVGANILIRLCKRVQILKSVC